MRQNDLMDVLVLQKRIYGKLNEVMDLTGQLAESADRKDQVSVQLLIAMRQGPLDELLQANEAVARKQSELSHEDGARLGELMGGAQSADSHEQLLIDQVATNRRMLDRVVALDRQVNRKVSGDDSIYTEK